MPLNAYLKIPRVARLYAIFLFYGSFSVENVRHLLCSSRSSFGQNVHKVCLSYFVVCLVFSDFWSAINVQYSFMFSLFILSVSQFIFCYLRHRSLDPLNEYLSQKNYKIISIMSCPWCLYPTDNWECSNFKTESLVIKQKKIFKAKWVRNLIGKRHEIPLARY